MAAQQALVLLSYVIYIISSNLPSALATNSSTCPDYAYDPQNNTYGQYPTINGADIHIDFVTMVSKSRVILKPNHVNFSADITAKFLGQRIVCNAADGCNFLCLDTAACYQANFTCNSNLGCNLKCSETFACGGTRFYATTSPNSQQIHIECYKDSCQEMKIFIANAQSVHIHCIEEDSCPDMTVQFTNISGGEKYNTSVTCYVQDACTNLKIFAYGAPPQLHMYSHSQGIVLNTFDRSIWKQREDTVTCDLNSKYIEYNYGADNLEGLTRLEYGQTHAQLPCEDITVNYFNGTANDSCVITYLFNDASIFDQLPAIIGNKFNNANCVYLALYDVATVQIVQCQSSIAPNPTRSPTWESIVTVEPTASPHIVLTLHPNIMTTIKPSAALPTSANPTSSPTCTNLYFSNNTDDNKADSIDFINSTANESPLIGPGTLNSMIIIDDSTQTLNCAGLPGDEFCMYANITCIGTSSNSLCSIFCVGDVSCAQATIQANYVAYVQIICNGKDACKEMKINTYNIGLSVSIHCISEKSCESIHISLNSNTQNTIFCYSSGACNNATIFTNNYTDTTLKLYSYSHNIKFYNGFGLNPESNNVECITKNKFIQYDSNLINNETAIRLLIHNQPDDKKFPCDNNVRMYCGENSCDVSFSILPLSSTKCNRVPIRDAVKIVCSGFCPLSPSNYPTTSPIKSPTIQTTLSFSTPSNSMTVRSGVSFDSIIVISVVVGVICIIIIIIIIFLLRGNKKQQLASMYMYREKQAIYMQHPMVIAIAIGDYEENPDSSEVDGVLQDLHGIDNDIKNIMKLYDEVLKYEIYPNYNMEDNIKTFWTVNEIMDLLKERAKYLNTHINNYDGLIVIISCHGINNNILTSDCKKIRKNVIHRLFSSNYASIRKLPRLFVYDCCHGDYDRHNHRRSVIRLVEENETQTEQLNEMGKGDQGKPVEMDSVSTENDILWANNEPNPDYRLIIINATNDGFQSKMNMAKGSYLIYKLMNFIEDNVINNDNKLFLSEMMDEIQKELHDTGKQLPETKYNNKTQYLKFKVNDAQNVIIHNKTEQSNAQENVKVIEMTGNTTLSNISAEHNDSIDE